MYILFDIGGTKMRLASSENLQSLGESQIIPTPQDFFEGIEQLKKVALELSHNSPIKGIAGGIAGPLNKEKTMLVNAPNIAHWANKPLTELIEKALGAPVYLENDAALCGLGESVFGAGKGAKIAVYMTLSTGVGGARFVNGKIDESSLGFEPGHQTINFDGPPCFGDGGIGHLEGYMSGKGLQEKYGKPAEQIDDPKVWDEEARMLAFGLNNIVVLWSPEIIVLGGSLTKKIDLEKVKDYVKKIVTIFPNPPEIKYASLGDQGGLYGAMAHLNSKSSS